MKKTYIEPKCRLMGVEGETLFASSPGYNQEAYDTGVQTDADGNVIMEGRETINSKDAWEEW